jgi:multiple sugar transport system permease protein
MWILHGYFLSLPRELEDAAMVDGCSRLGALFRIIYPIATPGLFAVSAFAFIGAWNAFFLPLVFTSSEATRTAPLAVAFLIGRFYVQFGLLAAAGTLASFIPVILALLFQRYILSGLVAGALKG